MSTPPPPSPSETSAWLAEQVATYLSLSPGEIRADVPLAEYGLDSVFALSLCGDIEDEFGIVTDPTLAWDYPTIEAISGFVTGELAGAGR